MVIAQPASVGRVAFYINGSLKPGGAERRFLRLFFYLRDLGYDIHLLTCEEGEAGFRALGFALDPAWSFVSRSPAGRRWSVYWMLIKQAFTLARWLRRKQIRHLHFCQNPSAFTFLCALLSPLSCPISVSLVDSIQDYRRNLRERIYVRVTAKFSSRIDCLSSQIKNDLCEFLGRRYEVKCGVAPCSFTEARSVEGVVAKDVDVALIARMTPGKGHALLRDALIELERANTCGVAVHVCGSGPLELEIRQDFAELRHQRIHMYYEKDSFQVLRRCRVFVSLQDTENYPSQSLLEAMMCGCAIIATDVGLTRLLIDESSGVLIRRDPSALAAALRRLLSDDRLCSDLGAAARRVVTTRQTIGRFAAYFVNDIIQIGQSPGAVGAAGTGRKVDGG